MGDWSAYKQLPRDHLLRQQFEEKMRRAGPLGAEGQLKMFVQFLPYFLGAMFALSFVVVRDASFSIFLGLVSLAIWQGMSWIARKKEERWALQDNELLRLNAEIEAELSRVGAAETLKT